MFKAILNQKQQKLGLYRQLILTTSATVHLYILYFCIYQASSIAGADSLSDFLKDCINEIMLGGESTRAAVIFIIILLVPSTAIITSTIIYSRKNYILATETSRGLLVLLVCCMLGYSGYVLIAAMSCFVWLLSVRHFYKSTINRKTI